MGDNTNTAINGQTMSNNGRTAINKGTVTAVGENAEGAVKKNNVPSVKEKGCQEGAETRLPLRSDTTPRRMTICKMCEAHLRNAAFWLKRIDTNAHRGRTVTSCQICHCRTYCGTFDVHGKREKG